MAKKPNKNRKRLKDSEPSALGKSILQGLREALAYERGELKESDGVVVHRFLRPERKVSVKEIRTKLGLTQEELALFMDASVRAVQHWEQESRTPDGPTLVLLRIMERHPQIVWETLQQAG